LYWISTATLSDAVVINLSRISFGVGYGLAGKMLSGSMDSVFFFEKEMRIPEGTSALGSIGACCTHPRLNPNQKILPGQFPVLSFSIAHLFFFR